MTCSAIAFEMSSGPLSTTIVSGKPCSTDLVEEPADVFEFDDLPERYFAFLQDDVD